MKKHAGFTLVEVLISIFVGMIIIAAIYGAVATGQRSTTNIQGKVVAGQDARAALELMSLEIQMASYNSNVTPGIWMAPTGDCDTQSTNQNYRGIQAATPSSISIEADINDNMSVARIIVSGENINPNEIITYTYDSANQYITRQTSCSNAIAFLGDTNANSNQRSLKVINTTGVPVFRYYNARGIEIPATGLPAGIPDIARIDVTLWVETENVDSNTRQPRRMIYSASVIPRNHVIR